MALSSNGLNKFYLWKCEPGKRWESNGEFELDYPEFRILAARFLPSGKVIIAVESISAENSKLSLDFYCVHEPVVIKDRIQKLGSVLATSSCVGLRHVGIFDDGQAAHIITENAILPIELVGKKV